MEKVVTSLQGMHLLKFLNFNKIGGEMIAIINEHLVTVLLAIPVIIITIGMIAVLGTAIKVITTKED